MLLQFFVPIEQDSSLMIIAWLVLKRFQHMVKVRYKKKCLKIINIERPTWWRKVLSSDLCVGF